MYSVSRPRACLHAYFPDSKQGWEGGYEGCVRMTCRSFHLEEEAGFGPKQREAVGMDPQGATPMGAI